ncbi:MAG: TolC family protein [Myxococcales bacterium]|jgi:outer membrane protein TolC|nr:TolC family protein [Myxococcales bacterium]
MRLRAFLGFVTATLTCGVASAQPAPASPDTPLPPRVTDPMLAPVSPARREIATWEEALAHVRARSVELRVALEEVTRAEAQWRQALATALPTLNATGTFTNQFITNETKQVAGIGAGGVPVFSTVRTPFPTFVNGSITLAQPLFAPRAWWAIGTANENRAIASLGVEDQKRQIALSVAQAIIGVFTAERIAELNRSGLRNSLERLDLTQRKLDLGAATGLDVVRARQDVEAARATLVTGDESLRRAREALGLAIGIPEQVGVSSRVRLDGLEQEAVQKCRPEALEERADVVAAHRRVDVAKRAAYDAKLQFLPTLSAQSSVSSTTIDTGASPTTTWNIQGLLSIPIWDGGARYGTMRDTNAQIRQAELRYESIVRTATIQMEQTKRGVEVAEERKKVATEGRRLAQQTDDLVRRAFQEGKGTSLELVAAASALRDAEITLALREFDVVQARVLAVLTFATCPY